MRGQRGSAADEKRSVHDLAPLVHFPDHADGRGGTNEADQQRGKAAIIHMQLSAQSAQRPEENAPKKLCRGKAAQHDDGDGRDDLHRLIQRHQRRQQRDIADVLHRTERQPNPRKRLDEPGKTAEQLRRFLRGETKAEYQRRREQQNREALREKGKKLHPAGKSAQYLRCGHGDETDQNPLGKGFRILRLQKPHPHRDGERQRASQRGGNQNARVKPDRRSGGETDRCLIAAHINGNKTAQHARVETERPPKRRERQGKSPDEEGREAENARHGERRGAQQTEALLKPLAQSQPVAKKAV